MATRKTRVDEYSLDTPTAPEPNQPAHKKEISFTSLKEKVVQSERQTKVYSLATEGGIWYKLRQNVTTKNPIRQIRYCPNEASIFVDEQSQYAIREQVAFRDGSLMADADSPNLQDYLDAHPDNFKNGGGIFYEVNTAYTAEEELDREFLLHDAVSMVRDKSIDELLPVAMFLSIDTNKKTVEIRKELLANAKANPKTFIEMFDNPIVKTKAIIIQAVDFQILKQSSESMKWYDTNKNIITTPAGQDTLDVMARFCLSDKGALVYSEVLDRLGKL
jgi:hypothetical protein